METVKYLVFIVSFYFAMNLIAFSEYKVVGIIILGCVMFTLWDRTDRKKEKRPAGKPLLVFCERCQERRHCYPTHVRMQTKTDTDAVAEYCGKTFDDVEADIQHFHCPKNHDVWVKILVIKQPVHLAISQVEREEKGA